MKKKHLSRLLKLITTLLLFIKIPLFSVDPTILVASSGAAGGIALTMFGQWLFKSSPLPHNTTVHFTTIHQTGSGKINTTIHTKTPEEPEKASFLHFLHEINFSNYAKGTAAIAITGYCYALYQIITMQKYLLDPQRISFWFSDREFNKLLLLEPKIIQELITQEFITTYKIKDQRELKASIFSFMQEVEKELLCLHHYQVFSQRLETIAGIGKKGLDLSLYAVRSLVPMSGILFDRLPSISLSSLLFIDTTLRNSIQERVARLHYYKNMFLQSSLII